jgi:hypothetical protein
LGTTSEDPRVGQTREHRSKYSHAVNSGQQQRKNLRVLYTGQRRERKDSWMSMHENERVKILKQIYRLNNGGKTFGKDIQDRDDRKEFWV